jgi:hypothetical protein
VGLAWSYLFSQKRLSKNMTFKVIHSCNPLIRRKSVLESEANGRRDAETKIEKESH